MQVRQLQTRRCSAPVRATQCLPMELRPDLPEAPFNGSRNSLVVANIGVRLEFRIRISQINLKRDIGASNQRHPALNQTGILLSVSLQALEVVRLSKE